VCACLAPRVVHARAWVGCKAPNGTPNVSINTAARVYGVVHMGRAWARDRVSFASCTGSH
jgi:hypothetical protein